MQKVQGNTKYIPCTVGVLTFNSANTLQQCLESVKDFAEIIICDGGSTDDTRAIAKRYNCRVIDQDDAFKNEENKLINYAGARNQCLDAASYDWFFYIDSDEIASSELVREVYNITQKIENTILVFNVSPRIILDGKKIEYSSNYPGWQKRLFHKSSGARFIKPVHERIKVSKNLKEGYLKGHWNYFISTADNIEKQRKYVDMEVKLMKERKKPLINAVFQRLIIILKIVLKSLRNYLFHGFKRTMPPALEWRRIRGHIMIIVALVKH